MEYLLYTFQASHLHEARLGQGTLPLQGLPPPSGHTGNPRATPDRPCCPLLSQCVLFGRSMLEHPVPSSLTVWAEPVFYLGYFPTVAPVLWGFLLSCPPLVTFPTAGGFTFVFAVSLSCCPSVRVILPHLTHPTPRPRALPYSSLSHQPDLQTEAESDLGSPGTSKGSSQLVL